MFARTSGIASHRQKEARELQLRQQGENLMLQNLEAQRQKFTDFARMLDKFVLRHSDKINEDPDFRESFHQMCTKMGVDPLMNSNIGLWSKLNIGKRNTKLGIQILTLCLASRMINGGVLDIDDVYNKINRQDYEITYKLPSDFNISRLPNSPASEPKSKANQLSHKSTTSKTDIIRAIESLDALGTNAISVIKEGSNTLIVSLPSALRRDHITCLKAAQKYGYIDYSMFDHLSNENNHLTDPWSIQRFKESIECFIRDKVVWVDDGDIGKNTKYWFPSIYLRILHSTDTPKSFN